MIRIAAAFLLLIATAAHAAPSDGACVDKGPVAIDFGAWALVVDDEDACPNAKKATVAPPVITEHCIARRQDHDTVTMRRVDGKWIETKEQTCLIHQK